MKGEKKMENDTLINPDRARELLSDRRLAVVGQKTGLSYMCLRNFQKGSQPSLTTLMKLTNYFAIKDVPYGNEKTKSTKSSEEV